MIRDLGAPTTRGLCATRRRSNAGRGSSGQVSRNFRNGHECLDRDSRSRRTELRGRSNRARVCQTVGRAVRAPHPRRASPAAGGRARGAGRRTPRGALRAEARARRARPPCRARRDTRAGRCQRQRQEHPPAGRRRRTRAAVGPRPRARRPPLRGIRSAAPRVRTGGLALPGRAATPRGAGLARQPARPRSTGGARARARVAGARRPRGGAAHAVGAPLARDVTPLRAGPGRAPRPRAAAPRRAHGGPGRARAGRVSRSCSRGPETAARRS